MPDKPEASMKAEVVSLCSASAGIPCRHWWTPADTVRHSRWYSIDTLDVSLMLRPETNIWDTLHLALNGWPTSLEAHVLTSGILKCQSSLCFKTLKIHEHSLRHLRYMNTDQVSRESLKNILFEKMQKINQNSIFM